LPLQFFSSIALSFSPLPSLWSFKLEKKLHWDSWRKGGNKGLATPSKWSRWSFLSIFLFFISPSFLFIYICFFILLILLMTCFSYMFDWFL
jgi:hypothetical protein